MTCVPVLDACFLPGTTRLDFKGALKDFVAVGGKITMPPRYALGVFYSRWWPYSDEESKGIGMGRSGG